MIMINLDLSADVIDVRDIIARFEELEDDTHADDIEERDTLKAILDDLCGAGGGDEQWRGDWYPVTLVRDSYFTDYAQELVEDCGDLPGELPHWIVVDWEATARNVRMDYTSTEIEGVTYWWR